MKGAKRAKNMSHVASTTRNWSLLAAGQLPFQYANWFEL